MASPFDKKYDAIRARILFYADKYGIDQSIAIWQIWQESKFDPNAQSPSGARGIAQFIPATAKRFGVNVRDIESSLNGWGKYMSLLLKMFKGRYDIALAGYNSGENRAEYKNAAAQGRAINWAVLPRGLQTETKNYIGIILGNAQTGLQSVAQTIADNPLAVGGISAGTLLVFGLIVFLVVD